MIPKFRAWSKKKKAMYYVFSIEFARKEIEVEGYEYSDIFPFDEVTLMQSTGLFDGNGEEVFEGDILLLRDSKFLVGLHALGGLYCQTLGSEAQDFHGQETTEEVDDFFKNLFIDCEIIGNIYENPELLN